MKIATIKGAEGADKDVEFKDGKFLIDNKPATRKQILELDELEVIDWSCEEVKEMSLERSKLKESSKIISKIEQESKSDNQENQSKEAQTSSDKLLLIIGSAILVALLAVAFFALTSDGINQTSSQELYDNVNFALKDGNEGTARMYLEQLNDKYAGRAIFSIFCSSSPHIVIIAEPGSGRCCAIEIVDINNRRGWGWGNRCGCQ